jgi:mxaL protein
VNDLARAPRWGRILQHAQGVQTGLLLLAIGATALTFLQPSIPALQSRYSNLYILDITQSMNALDYTLDSKPQSRLEFARAALRQTLRELPCGSRAGLGIFTEYRSFMLFAPVEVCENFHELSSTLSLMDGRMAWAGASEIAKGLSWGFRILRQLPEKTGIVFFTDGHEAPPVNLLHRPSLDVRPGEFRGLLVGTGGLTPLPIPKKDPSGNPLGYWKPDEVQQRDVYSQGRAGSRSEETLVEDAGPAMGARESAGAPQSGGSEHLSALHEAYLEQLAAESGLHYHRLRTAAGLQDAVRRAGADSIALVTLDARWIPGAIALMALLAVYAVPAGRRRRTGRP